MKYKIPQSQTLDYKVNEAEANMLRAVHSQADSQEIDRLREKYIILSHQKLKREELYKRRDLPSQ